MPKLYTRVVFVGKVSDRGQDRVAVAHRHKIVHLVPYVEIHLPEHVHGPPLANTALLYTQTSAEHSVFDIADCSSSVSR